VADFISVSFTAKRSNLQPWMYNPTSCILKAASSESVPVYSSWAQEKEKGDSDHVGYCHLLVRACVPKRLGCNKDDDENGDRFHPFGWGIIFFVCLDLPLDPKVYAPHVNPCADPGPPVGRAPGL
jgi:hypothetical protein